MGTMRGGLFAKAALAIATLVMACSGGNASAETLDQIYAKAKQEKSLVFYAGGPTAPWEKFAKDFQQRFPGIEVSITGGFSNVLDRKIDAQLNDKNLAVDMAIFQTIQDFVRWKKEGVLLAFKPAGFDKIGSHFKDKDGAYVGLQVNGHPYAYNSKLVRPEDVPKSALDFLKPEFRGKVVACYPADDDATLYLFDSIVRKYGWSYMDKFMANQPNFIQGHLGVVRSVSSGQNLVTIDSIYNMSRDQKEAGQPQEIAISTIDPLPVWALTAGIFKAAPHPNAAKLFVSWYLEKAQQTRIGTWSSRSDVPPPSGLPALSTLKLVNSYREFLTNEPQLLALRKRFEDYTGPVVNAGGVR